MLRLCCASAPTSARAEVTASACIRGCAAAAAASSSSSPISVLPVSAVFISLRHQRSTPSRPKSSSWKEKTQQFEERQREQQEEAVRAARRRARYTSSSSVTSSTTSADGSGHPSVNEDASPSSSSSVTGLTAPASGFWNFIKGGSKGRRTQPINPLLYLERMGPQSQFNPDARAAQRLIDAVNGLRRRNSRRKEPMTVQLSEEQKQEIVNRYAATRWYGPLYRPFQRITERQIRWTLRISHIVLIALVSGFLVMVFVVYRVEMETVAKLSPEDQADYAHMVKGMRYSDIYNTGKAVLDRDDPLEALPPEVRLHMAIDACREKNWHQMDWSSELRKMHPNTALADYDYVHCMYWAVLEVGRAMCGGGALFNDRILDVNRVRQVNAEAEEERERFVELEPTALPSKTQRGFFS